MTTTITAPEKLVLDALRLIINNRQGHLTIDVRNGQVAKIEPTPTIDSDQIKAAYEEEKIRAVKL